MLDIYNELTSKSDGNGVEELPPGAPAAGIHTIHLGRLQAGNAEESSKLFQACKNHGFFYLDLRHPGNDTFVKCINDVYALSEELFSLDIEEKLAYDVDKVSDMKLNGYVPGQAFGSKSPVLSVRSYKPLGRNLGCE